MFRLSIVAYLSLLGLMIVVTGCDGSLTGGLDVPIGSPNITIDQGDVIAQFEQTQINDQEVGVDHNQETDVVQRQETHVEQDQETDVVQDQETHVEQDQGDVRGGNEVVICHIPPGNPENAHTISIAESALLAHLRHGDTLGPCSDDCDDNNPCTEDEVDPDTGECIHTEVICDDGLFCNGEEICDGQTGQCIDGGNPCEPGQLCNEDDARCEPESVLNDVGHVWRTFGGELNGSPIDEQHYQITVRAGEDITGTIVVQTENLLPPNAVAPVGGTVNWGSRQSQPWLTNGWITTGIATYAVEVDKIAPVIPGVYHIIVAFEGEFTIEQVMSATNWTVGDVVWDDGNDLGFDWTDEDFDEALNEGAVLIDRLSSDGYGQRWQPATAVIVNVVEEQGSGFSDPSSWTTFDAGAHGVGIDPDGYHGAVYDGRYVYFVPNYNGTDYHSEVLRYDTDSDFDAPASWATFDPEVTGVGSNLGGCIGGVFDGRYVYFVPYQNRNGNRGEIVRYDTHGSFGDTTAWEACDPGAEGVGYDPDGFIGAVFDGRYVYFVPHHNGSSYSGEVLRFDSTGAFCDQSSWAAFDAGDHGIGDDPDGFAGAVFDGEYVYFVPFASGYAQHHGEVLRYNSLADFNSPSSWSSYDPGDHGVGNNPDGYWGGVFDGRYIYFVPNRADAYGSVTGEVLRFDTEGAFSTAESWDAFDPGDHGVGVRPDGYREGVFDGRYVYFVPAQMDSGEVLRYDVEGDFYDVSSWSTMDAGAHGVGTEPNGYSGAVFDGAYIYFAPFENSSGSHGEVLRYDTQ